MFDLVSFIPRAVMQGIPLMYGCTGETITEKSGNLNLGTAGIMYVGGICGVIGSFYYEQACGGAGMNGFLTIAIPMLCGVFVKRFSRRSGLYGLVGGIAVGLALFAVGAAYPFLREMVWIFPMTAVATVAFLAFGTWLFPDTPEEREGVDGFFRQLEGKA